MTAQPSASRPPLWPAYLATYTFMVGGWAAAIAVPLLGGAPARFGLLAVLGGTLATLMTATAVARVVRAMNSQLRAQERLVHQDHRGTTVVDHIAQVRGRKAQVHLQHDRAQAGDGPVQLEVAPAVPVQDADPVARLEQGEERQDEGSR